MLIIFLRFIRTGTLSALPAAKRFRNIKICSSDSLNQGVGCEAITNTLLRRHHRIVHNQPTNKRCPGYYRDPSASHTSLKTEQNFCTSYFFNTRRYSVRKIHYSEKQLMRNLNNAQVLMDPVHSFISPLLFLKIRTGPLCLHPLCGLWQLALCPRL